jgi:tripartite-type tricarboxylate transporter receptor subunit TctC
MRRILWLTGLAFWTLMLISFAVGSVFAESFPTKTIRMVVPFVPGGPTDTFARITAQELSKKLGQQVIIENRGGANGIIGTEIVAKAPPDGYTLLFHAPTPIATPSLFTKLPFDVDKDFVPITLPVKSINLLAAHPSFPINTISELVALAKAKPGQINCAVTTLGGLNHLTLELFNSRSGIKLQYIAYKGASPALMDLLGGHVPLMFNTIGLMMPHVKAGKLNPLAVTSLKRADFLPNVPAIAESLPGFESDSWFGIWGPAGMPKEIVTFLNTEIAKALSSPEAQKRCKDLYAETVGNSPEEFARFVKSERIKLGKIIKETGLHLD